MIPQHRRPVNEDMRSGSLLGRLWIKQRSRIAPELSIKTICSLFVALLIVVFVASAAPPIDPTLFIDCTPDGVNSNGCLAGSSFTFDLSNLNTRRTYDLAGTSDA